MKRISIAVVVMFVLGIAITAIIDVANDDKKVHPDISEDETVEDQNGLEEDQVEHVKERYLEIADEYDIITKIEPKEEDYTQINVMIDEAEYEYLGYGQQEFLDEVGELVEGNTRSILYQTPVKEFLYVYFVNEKFEQVAKTSHFERGWSPK